MKIIHFFPYEKFTKDYICLINDYDRIHNHVFVLTSVKVLNNGYGTEDNIIDFNKYENVNDYTKLSIKEIMNLIHSSDKIIIHSLFHKKRLLIALSLYSLYCQKIYLVCWGGDINISNEKSIKGILRFLRIYITRKMKHVLLSKSDRNNICDFIHELDGHLIVNYIDRDDYNQYHIETTFDSKTVNILIGNSASKTNYHYKILKILEKFKEERIHLYIPLSYGDSDYADLIEKEAKKIYGNKVTTIKQFLNKKEYMKLLDNVDIGIFAFHRQQGLGNIFALTQKGKKIFIDSKGILWNDLVVEKGYKFYDICAINEHSFNEFVKYPSNERCENLNTVKNDRSINRTLELWYIVFND